MVIDFKEDSGEAAHMNLSRRSFVGHGIKGTLALAAGARLASAQQHSDVSASFAHIAFGGAHTADGADTWVTEFLFTNLGGSQASLGFRWYGDDGQPIQVPVAGGSRSASHQYQIAPNSTLNVRLDDSLDALTQGWAAVDITGAVDGQAIYHSRSSNRPEYRAALMRNGSQEGLILMGGVPVTPVPAPRSLFLRFDNNGHVTGVAFANVTNVSQTLALDYLDSGGAVLMSQAIPLGPRAHTAFVVGDRRLTANWGILRVAGDASPFSAIAFVHAIGPAGGSFATLLPLVC